MTKGAAKNSCGCGRRGRRGGLFTFYFLLLHILPPPHSPTLPTPTGRAMHPIGWPAHRLSAPFQSIPAILPDHFSLLLPPFIGNYVGYLALQAMLTAVNNAILLAAVLLGSVMPSFTQPTPRVVIVGGGLAGLSAALEVLPQSVASVLPACLCCSEAKDSPSYPFQPLLLPC